MGEPFDTMHRSLGESRERGVEFFDAWSLALLAAGVRTGSEWQPVLEDVKAHWKAAYLGLEREGDAALGLLCERGEELRTGHRVTDAPTCEHCGDPIPPERGRFAKFCSERHRKAASRERTAA